MALAVRLEQPKVRIAAHNCDLKLILIPIINVVVIVSYNGANIQLFFNNKDDNQKKLNFFSINILTEKEDSDIIILYWVIIGFI